MRIRDLVYKKVKVVSLAPELKISDMDLGEHLEVVDVNPDLLKNAELSQNDSCDFLADANIVICDENMGISLCDLKQLCNKDVKIILCLSPSEEKKLDEEVTNILSDIWLTPLFPPRAKMRLQNLAQAIIETWLASLRAMWLDTLMELIPDMVWIKTINGKHVKVNQAFCNACGKTRKMVEGKNHAYIWNVKEDVPQNNCEGSEYRVIETGEVGIFEEILKIGDKYRKLRTYKAPLRDSTGQIFGTLGIAHDITTLQNLDLELRIFMDSMPFPMLMLNEKGVVTHMNNEFLESFREIGSDILSAVFSSWKEWAFEPDPYAPGENIYTLIADESMRKIQITERALQDMFGDVFGYICVFRDVTAESELHDLIWRNAHIDGLTGLNNRNALYEFIESCQTAPSCIIYIDLDNFKSVNDTYGHESGDEALVAVAELLSNTFPDDFIVRQGGDEFMVIVMRPTTPDEISTVTKTLKDGADEIFHSVEQFDKLGISIGISSEGDDIHEMIRNADNVMYKVKKDNKNAQQAAPGIPKP